MRCRLQRELRVSGREASAIYDYKAGGYTQFSGTVGTGNVSVYDYGRGCYVNGSPSSLYDYGGSHHIQLNVNGHDLSGYDYGSSSHFNGRVTGNSISVYDYEHGEYFNYSI